MVMTHRHWISQTRRALKPRSRKLKELDRAIAAYHKGRVGGTAKNITLFTALLDWATSKADFRASIRNSKREPSGKGTVETLLDEVMALNPAFRMRAAPLFRAAAPVQSILGKGRVYQARDEDGQHFKYVLQEKEYSCGAACTRIVINLVNDADAGEEYLRELVDVAEANRNGVAYTGSLGTGGALAISGAHDWSPTGGGTWLVPNVLKAVRPAISATHGSDVGTLLTTTKKKPAIGVVAWSLGGLHYVVVAGRLNGGRMRVLDPTYGLQTVGVTGGRLDNYQPLENGAVVATATWDNWVCKVK